MGPLLSFLAPLHPVSCAIARGEDVHVRLGAASWMAVVFADFSFALLSSSSPPPLSFSSLPPSFFLLHLLHFFRVSLSHRLPSLLLCFPFRFFPFLFFFLLFLSFLQRHLILQVDPSFLLLLLSCLFRLPSSSSSSSLFFFPFSSL